MSRQTTFAGLAWKDKGKIARRERFLADMDALISWARRLTLIEPHYPKVGRGRQPLGLEKLLRIFFPAVVQPVRPAGGRCDLRQ